MRSYHNNVNRFLNIRVRKVLSLMLLSVLLASPARAVIANPSPAIVPQPDGATLTISLHGDEFSHFVTTADGYTVVQDSNGVYKYARLDDGKLCATDIVAHDMAMRSIDEQKFLSSVQRYIAPEPTAAQSAMRADRASAKFDAPGRGVYDYKQFRGLVILVEYNDRTFSIDNPQELFGGLINTKDYTGYTANGKTVSCTGSVRDYFYDNSTGAFDPQFDVVGPVTIDYSMYYASGTENARTLVKAACEAADETVDFSKYDSDGDGTVDMFYLIFAGPGSNFTNNDSRLIWPHAWSLTGTTFDGVSLSRYACSVEIYGLSSSKKLDGIGTICHEFSHVLGLKDEYDTDYASSGGTSAHPGKWSLMASGSYLNESKTPAGYSLLERFQSGFTTPEVISATGSYTLKDIDTSNHGYMIGTAQDNEYFLLENRRNGKESKWNKYVPGHGMLVFRVDSTDVKSWTNNKLNINPEHNYYELLRATPKVEDSVTSDSGGDPFPGTGGVTSLSSQTSPSLQSWTKLPPEFAIDNIVENSNGDITFNIVNDPIDILREGWESVTTSGSNDSGVQGSFCTWTFTKAQVASPSNSSYCTGKHAVSMVRGSIVESSVISGKTSQLSFRATNAGTLSAVINVLYHDSYNDAWTALVSDSSTAITVAKGTTVEQTIEIPEDIAHNLCFQIKELSGSTISKVWLDDIMLIRQDDTTTGIASTTIDNADATADLCINGDILTIRCSADNGTAALYDIAGRRVASAVISDGAAQLRLPSRGCYIVKTPSNTMKLTF